MVMEASPSPQSVGREFVRQYYTLLNKAPAHLHRFYNNYSSFVHGGLDAPNRETLPVVGQKQIHNRIQQLNFRDCHAKISQVDAQATLGNGVVVQVTGELSNGGAPMRRFTQTFVLAAQSPKKYYVHNDIFRYQDIVFSDEEGEGSGRSEGEEEEGPAGGYFPGGFAAAPFPAPPAPPHALVSPPAHLSPAPPTAPPAAPAAPPAAPAPAPAPHLNGHPHEDPTRHLVAALQGATVSGGAGAAGVSAAEAQSPELSEPQPEPEPEREPSPPPQPAAPQAPAEPKTYANLLKSGSRSSPPAPAPPAPAAPPAPLDPRPPRRDQRDSRDGRDGRESRRYSDSQQLFLGNLPHSATEEELRALFGRFGPVAELRVHSKPAAPGAPRHPNYGFITYETPQAAAECLNAAPLFYPAESGEGCERVKLNVEEKKARRGEAPRRRPPSAHRAAPRQPYRR
ncbi:ras GTPase-activating protein-binding protein 2 [Colias croceus]|uniref:ras GTPase-activating protein-binding protein 2 n=1 Tax=Colias crocea TaxID=72248 RepID=UPI001E27E551|nr:ras GTPase-activating protein-binding protein 2 [Colias croceus]